LWKSDAVEGGRAFAEDRKNGENFTAVVLEVLQTGKLQDAGIAEKAVQMYNRAVIEAAYRLRPGSLLAELDSASTFASGAW
jgi:hypothetical protein